MLRACNSLIIFHEHDRMGAVLNSMMISFPCVETQGSVFHNATPRINAGVKFSFSRATGNTTFGVAGVYALDSTTKIKAKIDRSLNMGLAYTQNLNRGVTLGMSANVRAHLHLTLACVHNSIMLCELCWCLLCSWAHIDIGWMVKCIVVLVVLCGDAVRISSPLLVATRCLRCGTDGIGFLDVDAVLCMQVNTANLNGDGHSLGLVLGLEAL